MPVWPHDSVIINPVNLRISVILFETQGDHDVKQASLYGVGVCVLRTDRIPYI